MLLLELPDDDGLCGRCFSVSRSCFSDSNSVSYPICNVPRASANDDRTATACSGFK